MCENSVTVTHIRVFLLPPANEVWGKVMFLHLSIILFTGEGCVSQHAMARVLCVSQGGVCRGVSAQAGVYHTPLGQTPPTEIANEAGGTHPARMYSCLLE